MNNNLDTRIQHAVIGETNNAGKTTATDDVPLKGEIIFNSTLDNFRIGVGDNTPYSSLPDFLPSIPAAQIQSDWNQTDNTQKDFIKNKPTLFSGNYNDLTNKPTIPAAQVNSDWNAQSGVAQILNKPTTETWTFILSDGTSVTKNVLISN